MEEEKKGSGSGAREADAPAGEGEVGSGGVADPLALPGGKAAAAKPRRVLKIALIALGLLALCILILNATHTYGVWVISGIALVLFAVGMLRKDSPSEGKPGAAGKNADGDRP